MWYFWLKIVTLLSSQKKWRNVPKLRDIMTSATLETKISFLCGVILAECFHRIIFVFNCNVKIKLSFPNILDMIPFCRATDTPVLDFWWRLLWVSKPEWVLPYLSLVEAYVLCYTFPEINLWCDTCQPSWWPAWQWSRLFHISQYLYVEHNYRWKRASYLVKKNFQDTTLKMLTNISFVLKLLRQKSHMIFSSLPDLKLLWPFCTRGKKKHRFILVV